VLRRDLIEQHGLHFDPQIVIGPDWDFMTRYSQWAQFGYVDAHTCLYRVHQTNVTVRVDRQRRASYLARCREKAIQLKRFGACSLQTRRDVFYDLLVVQLLGYPQRQDEITTWPQFLALPSATRAQLLRLMAAEALLAESTTPKEATRWLEQARRLDPADWRTALLLTLQRVSAPLARRFLRSKRATQQGIPATSPFKNLN
jgi:hypothetical protein